MAMENPTDCFKKHFIGTALFQLSQLDSNILTSRQRQYFDGLSQVSVEACTEGFMVTVDNYSGPSQLNRLGTLPLAPTGTMAEVFSATRPVGLDISITNGSSVKCQMYHKALYDETFYKEWIDARKLTEISYTLRLSTAFRVFYTVLFRGPYQQSSVSLYLTMSPLLGTYNCNIQLAFQWVLFEPDLARMLFLVLSVPFFPELTEDWLIGVMQRAPIRWAIVAQLQEAFHRREAISRLSRIPMRSLTQTSLNEWGCLEKWTQHELNKRRRQWFFVRETFFMPSAEATFHQVSILDPILLGLNYGCCYAWFCLKSGFPPVNVDWKREFEPYDRPDLPPNLVLVLILSAVETIKMTDLDASLLEENPWHFWERFRHLDESSRQHEITEWIARASRKAVWLALVTRLSSHCEELSPAGLEAIEQEAIFNVALDLTNWPSQSRSPSPLLLCPAQPYQLDTTVGNTPSPARSVEEHVGRIEGYTGDIEDEYRDCMNLGLPYDLGDTDWFQAYEVPSSDNVDNNPDLLPKKHYHPLNQKISHETTHGWECLSKASEGINEEQQSILRLVMKGNNVFYTGAAGTGKTKLLLCIVSFLDMVHHPSAVVGVTAATGLAAFHLGGNTIHTWAGIGTGEEAVLNLLKMVRRNKGAMNRWVSCKVLIIDEIGMISGDLLDKLEEIAREIRENSFAWGGIQVIFVGDFHQLPPIAKENPVPLAFTSHSWSYIQQHAILTRVFRQTEPELRALLEEVRMSELGPTSRALLKTLGDMDRPTKNAIHLTSDRSTAKRINSHHLDLLNGGFITFDSMDINKTNNKRMLDGLLADSQIRLKIGARVMLIKNLTTTGGENLVNGMTGKVVGFLTKNPEGEESVKGVAMRKKGQLYPLVTFLRPDGSFTQWIGPQNFIFEAIGPRGKPVLLAQRKQIPLVLGWAMTIHKSQGQSLKNLIVDLDGCGQNGHIYVALSRATNLKGLKIENFLLKNLKTSPDVKNWMKTVKWHV